jgi:hypothetical protein
MKKLFVVTTFALASNFSHAALALGGGDSGVRIANSESGRLQSHLATTPHMLGGVITSFNLDQGEIVVHGNHLRLSPAIRVFGAAGSEDRLSSLRVGQEIHFLLDPKDASERTISVIYLR